MAAANVSRRLGRLAKNSTSFFLCDMQEKFSKTIKYFPDIVTVQQRLIAASKILNIPLIVTEQYPQGLGKTVSDLDTSQAKGIFPKTGFSMVLPEVETILNEMPQIKSVVLFGIEAHVCIHHTALDLLDKNYEVHIVADAVSSRSMVDRMYGIERLRQSGALITTSECVLLALMGGSKHPLFKEIQKLITTSAPETGLLSKL